LVFIVRDYICVERPNVENWITIDGFWHREKFDVDVQLCQVLSALFCHKLLSLSAWVVVICKEEDALRKTLLLYGFELLVADP
jgi:hypothetical protein